jgi:predicted AAA+ superfamily ATPase
MSKWQNMIKRDIYQTVTSRLLSPRQFIQVLIGSRQVGKTTLSRQIIKEFPGSKHYFWNGLIHKI